MRKAGAAALGHVGPTAVDAVAALIKVARDDPSMEPRLAAASSLLLIAPDNVEATRGAATLLKSDNYSVDSWLREMKDKAGPLLAAGLKHDDAAVRKSSLERLGRMEHTGVGNHSGVR